MKRFIFLDIDGVISGDEEWEYFLSDNSCGFNRESLICLEYVIDNFPEIKIIISSTWRKGQTVEQLKQLFQLRNFKYWDNIEGRTGVLCFEKNPDGYMTVPRGCEIEMWLRSNTESPTDQYKYAIIDDGSDMMYYQKDSFVHIYYTELFNMKYAQKVIEILK